MMRTLLVLVAVILGIPMIAESTVAPPVSFDPGAERMLVLFDQLPTDARERFARVGITHAALFERAYAAAVVGSSSAYRAIATWEDVELVYP